MGKSVTTYAAAESKFREWLDGDGERGSKRIAPQYRRAFLEYVTDPQSDGKRPGDKWDPTQFETILETIKASRKPLLVVVYIHGWHHNADREGAIARKNWRSNALKFDDMMVRFAHQLQHLKTFSGSVIDHDVLGVYVGWRGESDTTPLYTILTIAGRSRAADLIGTSVGFKADMQSLTDAISKGRDSHISAQSRVLIIGHSLGGRLLTRAFLPDVAANPSVAPLGENTKIVAINSAIGSDFFDEIYLPEKSATSINPVPYWINLTSKDDYATSTIYPMAAFLGLAPAKNRASPFAGVTIGHSKVADPMSPSANAASHYLTHELSGLQHLTTERRREHIRDKESAIAILQPLIIAEPGDWRAAIRGMTVEESKRVDLGSLAVPCKEMFNRADVRGALGIGTDFPIATTRCVTDWQKAALNPGRSTDIGLVYHELTRSNSARSGVYAEQPNAATFYRARLNTIDRTANRVEKRVYPAEGRMWTIRTDHTFIDFGDRDPSPETGTGVHNGYVQTSIARLLLELTFEGLYPRNVDAR